MEKWKAGGYDYWLVALLGVVFFMPFLGGVHLFDWDEINFAECAREMIVSGNYSRATMDFQPFWEKPPLFFWLQAASMKIWGINEYGARFPDAVCGTLTLALIFHWGKQLFGRSFGRFWALSFLGSLLPCLYSKSGLIDPWFNLFIFSSLYFLIRSIDLPKSASISSGDSLRKTIWTSPYWPAAAGGFFSGLAMLTKGPVGFLIVLLTWGVKISVDRVWGWRSVGLFALFGSVALGVVACWLGAEIARNGYWFLETFVRYQVRLARTQDAGHGGFFGYHFVALFFGCFPASIFALDSMSRRFDFPADRNSFIRWMKTLFWVGLILFSLVQSKIVHYSSICYLPLTFLSALTLQKSFEKGFLPTYIVRLLLLVGAGIGLAVCATVYAGQHIELLKPWLNGDPFAAATLSALVVWSGWEYSAGIFLMGLLVAFARFNVARRIFPSAALLFMGVALFVNLTLILFINHIEGYSQRAAVAFLETKKDEDCYIKTYGYHSYAPFYYGGARPGADPRSRDLDFLLHGSVDKPVYIISKINYQKELDAMPTLVFLKEEGGFLFYIRK